MSVKPKTVGRYRRLDKIGYGNFGVVYKGVDSVTNRVVAIKTLDLDTVEDEVESVQHEVSSLSHLSAAKSSNVTKYYGTVLDGSKSWIIMDSCSGGSVRTLLKSGSFEDKYLGVLFREIAIAVQAIHSEGIIHRDLKAANILITLSGHVKLCDFGVAAVSQSHQSSKRNTVVGTPYWMAPEVITEGQSYTNKADIWSLGITFYEIVTGNPPYAGHEAMRALMLITSSRPPRLEGPKYTPNLKDLVALCLDEDPKARPSAEDISKHRFSKTYAKVPTTISKSLVDKYVQWKRVHHDHRDSLLMFNPHRDEEDDALKNDSDSESVWDFGADDQLTTNPETHQYVDDMSDAPNSFRELYGIPPILGNDDSPMDTSPDYSMGASTGRIPASREPSIDAVTSQMSNTVTPMGTLTQENTQPHVQRQSSHPEFGGAQSDIGLSKPEVSSTSTPTTLAATPFIGTLEFGPQFNRQPSQLQGSSTPTQSSHQTQSQKVQAPPPAPPPQPSHQPSQSLHSSQLSQPQLLSQQQQQQTPPPLQPVAQPAVQQLSLHQSSAQPQAASQPSSPQPHKPSSNQPGFVFPPAKPAVDDNRLPSAFSIGRSRSTTISATPSMQAGSWKGWRGRHGSEVQLDHLKRQNTTMAINHPTTAATATTTASAANAIPQLLSGSGDELSDAGTVSPRSGLSRANSVSDRFVNERHPSIMTPAGHVSTVPPDSSPANSPTSSPTITAALSDRESDRSFEPILDKLPASSVSSGSSNHPGKISLPRLQMPPRPNIKQSFSTASATRSKRPVVWPSEFPPMPQLDLNTSLDSTPDNLVVATSLELTLSYKTAICSLAGQFE